MWQYNYGPELYHHGIKGMRWGVRRFQRKDGSLTPAGKKRYSDDDSKAEQSSEKKGLTSNQKKAIAIGTAVVAAALVTYGAYKLGAFEKFKKTGMDAVKGVLEDAIDPNAKNWIIDNKEAILVLAPVCVGALTTCIKVAGKRANLNKEQDLKDLYCYDRSLGHYWRLRRELTNAEWIEIDQRKKNGERLGDILDELTVLK